MKGICLSVPVGRQNTHLRQSFSLSPLSWPLSVLCILFVLITTVTSFSTSYLKVPLAERGRELLVDMSESDVCHAQENIQIEGNVNNEMVYIYSVDNDDDEEMMANQTAPGSRKMSVKRLCGWHHKQSEMNHHTDPMICRFVMIGEYRHLQEEFLQVPRNRFQGHQKTCNDQALQKLISSVMMACGAVQRDCAPSAKKVKQVPLAIENTVRMYPDTNAPDFDYNDGFREHQLTPEDCHRRCLYDRGCQAWIRTASGQCWLKYFVPPEDTWREIVGDVSGLRTSLNVTCGERVEGVAYDIANPTEKHQEARENPDACCQMCASNSGCVVWSFFGGICRIIFSYGYIKQKNPIATTAFISSEPYDCSGQSEAAATPEEIARAYNPECASILLRGPGKDRSRCRGIEDANNIFDAALARIQRVFE